MAGALGQGHLSDRWLCDTTSSQALLVVDGQTTKRQGLLLRGGGVGNGLGVRVYTDALLADGGVLAGFPALAFDVSIPHVSSIFLWTKRSTKKKTKQDLRRQ